MKGHLLDLIRSKSSLAEYSKKGKGSDAALIGKEIGSEIYERAIESSELLSFVATGSANSPDYHEVVTVGHPDANKGAELTSPTQDSGLSLVSHKNDFVKVETEISVSDELVNEASSLNAAGSIERLIGTSAGSKIANMLMLDPVVGITRSHVEATNSLLPDETRDTDKFMLIKTGVAGSFGSDSVAIAGHLNSLIASIPAEHYPHARWYMNGDTYKELRQALHYSSTNPSSEMFGMFRNADGSFELSLLGFPVTIIQADDSGSDGAIPLMFGDLAASIKLVDLENSQKTINEPYSVKGSAVLYHSRRFTTVVLSNKALRLSLQSV